MEGQQRARSAIEAIYNAALAAADPRRAVFEALQRREHALAVRGEPIQFEGRVVVVAVGKAAVTMARGAEEALGDAIAAGIAITKDGHTGDARLERIEIAEASHPIPDERGVAATKRALDLVREASADDLVLALISGGGSALFEAPREPVTLAEMATVTDLLLRAGTPITELNRVRTPLSLVKGGGLLAAAGATPVVTLILSDVLGNDPRIIASGPTVPGKRDGDAARAILERFALWERVPAPVRDVLGTPDGVPEKPGRASRTVIIADNGQAVEAAERAARNSGLHPTVIWHEATGEARERGVEWADACVAAPEFVDCLLAGGEMTVTVTGDGIGGRNTEFALAAAMRLRELGRTDWVVASLATDGQDGPTNVAGAVLDAADVERMIALGFDLAASLERNDTLAPLQAIGAVIAPGPTGTNVNDLYVAVRVVERVFERVALTRSWG